MKTYETLKWGKGYYIMTRTHGHAEGREFFKTKTAMSARIKELKAKGYAEA